MHPTLRIALASAVLGAAALAALSPARRPAVDDSKPELGNFSVSLTVKDLARSRAFYETLGFEVVGGVQEQNWLVLRNGTTKIGLFQGMFEKNMLTFNPGWDSDAKTLERFTDVRELQARFEAAGLKPEPRADPKGDGTAYLMLVDPDGNPLLFDQHVPKPK
jgi:catechol 2,3-dioxygenase-like lactoylglutathione lyase family enzyme